MSEVKKIVSKIYELGLFSSLMKNVQLTKFNFRLLIQFSS